MNYSIIADYLWYTGNVLSGISIIFSPKNYYLSVSLVLFGQFITITSEIGSFVQDSI